MKTALFFHIVAGSLGLVAGAIALYTAKGSEPHKRIGLIFVAAMLTMSITGAGIAAINAVETSVIAGLLTAYLVATAWTTVRPVGKRVHISITVVGIGIGLAGYGFGLDSVSRGEMMRDGLPVPMLFVFATVATVAALSDLRNLRVRLKGARRLIRHLWRMCFALFIASASFFLGQADKIPESIRFFPLLAALAFAPIAIMFYWIWRVRARRPTANPTLQS